MAFSEDQVMLTLAALTYRGFQDILTGTIHEEIVREALLDGLETFEPVQDQWELVWGPATTRQVPLKAFRSLALFDWNAMYVVRHRTLRNKYAIAIRGTNPVASQDWVFGDLWVGTTVPWPYTGGKEFISTSTALGLASLQGMRSERLSNVNSITHRAARSTLNALHAIVRRGEKALNGLMGQTNDHKLSHVEQQVTRTIQHWIDSLAERDAVKAQLKEVDSELRVESHELRPKLAPESERDGPLDLLTFLATEADKSTDGLEVTVTGHSKGGALAPAVALWLKEALGSDETECWDTRQMAKVRFFAFAGPTPGNREFAGRIDALLGDDCHQLINTNDIVPHAFQADDLAKIPALYGERTAPLEPLVSGLVADVAHLNYRHPANGLRKFTGALLAARPFPLELVYQHLDAYLAELQLLSDEINAITVFI